jgi:dephospho-CoA kinase
VGDDGVGVPFIGLTGGLGAGKSTALAALERLGAAVLSTDAVVHELYEGDEVRDAVTARWGAEVAPGGCVDRSAVAARAFADPAERAWLESLLWPLVGARVVAWREEVEGRRPAPPAAVVETPLLFEEAVRAARAEARGHEALDERAARQLPQEEKARRATFTVSNAGTVEDLERELSAVLEKLDP